MEQREVTDRANTRWTCVQAYAGTDEQSTDKITEKTEQAGKVQVVCTPGGGAQSVRLELVSQWMEKLSDDELLEQIALAQQK